MQAIQAKHARILLRHELAQMCLAVCAVFVYRSSLICHLQVWSGSSDGSIAVTNLDSAGKLDLAGARSLKMPSGKGELHLCCAEPCCAVLDLCCAGLNCAPSDSALTVLWSLKAHNTSRPCCMHLRAFTSKLCHAGHQQ